MDLGCWPGSWLQVLARRAGPDGLVVGVDVETVEPVGGPVTLLKLDVTDADAPERIAAALGGRSARAVLSDAAPKLTGIRDVDRAALEELYDAALRIAERVLDPRGWLLVKGFPGPDADRFRAELRRRFARVTEVRPQAKRSTSKEHYWLAAPSSGAGPSGSWSSHRRPS